MSRILFPPDARIKLSPGLRLAAHPPERDGSGRILNAGQAKEAQRARMVAADQARIAAAAAMLPSVGLAFPGATGPGAGAPPVTRDSRGDHHAELETPMPTRKR